MQLREDSLERSKAVNKAIYSNARKAAVMSALLPGLGQAYNRKFWKIPVLYAGLGGLGYMFVQNNREFNFFRTNLRAITDSDSTTINKTEFGQEQLQSQKLYYRKFRDFAAIGIGLLYLLNIVDANVDAHLKTFDVSDDLSVVIDPYHDLVFTGKRFGAATGISVKLKLR
jgi:hypothetical protein